MKIKEFTKRKIHRKGWPSESDTINYNTYTDES